jgi:glycerophosphoryl diester phosphodiesterase
VTEFGLQRGRHKTSMRGRPQPAHGSDIGSGRARLRRLIPLFVLLVGGLYATNQSSLLPPTAGVPKLLAHRGVHQTFASDTVDDETCTARLIHAPEHSFLENTVPSIRAAFEAGADRVEFDVQPTRDGELAVFHDATLECRTDGRGAPREHTIAELKRLDLGYGYTADGGRTFPFRGRGRGLMSTLNEILAAFPQHRFVVHMKTNRREDGTLLAEKLRHLRPVQLAALAVLGPDVAVAAFRAALPVVKARSRNELISCLLRYAALGWSGYVPAPCRNTVVLVPMDVAPWLWGWPHRLQRRLASTGSEMVVKGPAHGGSGAIDSLEQVRSLPSDFAGTIWTNRIELMQRWKQARRR